MKVKECKFCELYGYLKKSSAKFHKEHNKDPESTFRLKSRYTAALQMHTYRTGGATVNYAGCSTYGNMPLRYCPVCDRKLTGKKNA